MPAEGRRRPVWAEVSRSAVSHNVGAMRAVLGDSALCAVVKADAYGHGALIVASAALGAGAETLAVAIVDEGIELRRAGVTAPIILLGEVERSGLGDALAHSLTLTIGSIGGARAAVAAAERAGGVHRVHVKVDTGMHRLGAAPDDVEEVVGVLAASPSIDLEGLYTHFSVADGSNQEDRAFTKSQLALFRSVVATLGAKGLVPRVLHAANSAGALGLAESRLDQARVGLALYGYLPDPWLTGALEEAGVTLEPALSLRARVVAVRRVEAGARPSYRRRRELARRSTIATVPLGYADGFPRRLFDAGAQVLVNGQRYPLAGNVTMDQIVIDCADDGVSIGDEVVLIGRQGDEAISADDWARWAGTISYEVLCGIGARVLRVAVD